MHFFKTCLIAAFVVSLTDILGMNVQCMHNHTHKAIFDSYAIYVHPYKADICVHTAKIYSWTERHSSLDTSAVLCGFCLSGVSSCLNSRSVERGLGLTVNAEICVRQ